MDDNKVVAGVLGETLCSSRAALATGIYHRMGCHVLNPSVCLLAKSEQRPRMALQQRWQRVSSLSLAHAKLYPQAGPFEKIEVDWRSHGDSRLERRRARGGGTNRPHQGIGIDWPHCSSPHTTHESPLLAPLTAHHSQFANLPNLPHLPLRVRACVRALQTSSNCACPEGRGEWALAWCTHCRLQGQQHSRSVWWHAQSEVSGSSRACWAPNREACNSKDQESTGRGVRMRAASKRGSCRVIIHPCLARCLKVS